MEITSRGSARTAGAGTDDLGTDSGGAQVAGRAPAGQPVAGRGGAGRAGAGGDSGSGAGPEGRPGQAPLPPRHRRSRIPLLAAVWSAATALLGLWWWLRPGSYPFAPVPGQPKGTVLDVVPAAVVPPVLVGAGLAGLGVAALAATGRARVVVAVTAVVWVVVFGLAVPGLAPLMLTGYAMAMLGPPVLFATVLAGAWRWRGGPAAVAVFLLVGGLGWITGLADAKVLGRYGAVVTGTLEKMAPPAILLFFLVGALVWAALGVRAVRSGGAAPAWTRPEAAARWGRSAVVVAVVCALPYGLHRLTWLTPWPMGMDAAALAAQPEMRLHGLLLGLAALAGAVLTSGLVARWGEVWPRWVPLVRGRRVPVAAAAVPGALVAALFTVAAVPMMMLMSVGGNALWGLLVFPFPVWGPALGLAVLGYVLRRRGESVRPGTIEGS